MPSTQPSIGCGVDAFWRADVTYRVASWSPPNAQAVGFVTGSGT